MKILTETYYDFKDVLIQPKRSNLCSRNQVDLEKTITFLHSKRTWTGVPILASNMDTTGTIEMYRELSKFKMITIFHKHYKNLIKGAYDRNEKYVKRPSTRKRKPKKYLD